MPIVHRPGVGFGTISARPSVSKKPPQKRIESTQSSLTSDFYIAPLIGSNTIVANLFDIVARRSEKDRCLCEWAKHVDQNAQSTGVGRHLYLKQKTVGSRTIISIF
jgi:hypothetical protein